jgi:hypothetical protein
MIGYVLQRQKCDGSFAQIEEQHLQHKCIYGIKAFIWLISKNSGLCTVKLSFELN